MKLGRRPRPDPKSTYTAVVGFAADPPFLVPAGTRLAGTDPVVVQMFKRGAADFFLVGDDLASAHALQGAANRLAARTESRTEAPFGNVRLPGPIPSERRVMARRVLALGSTFVPAGQVIDKEHWLVKRYPAEFVPAQPETD